MSKNEHIYSYVERKIIDVNMKHTFDEKRYKIKSNNNKDNKDSLKALLIGATLGFILVAIIILKDLYTH